MFWSRVILLSAISWHVSESSEICFDCRNIPFPRNCDRVMKCGPDSMCYTEKIITGDGIILYNTGCWSKERCQRSSKRSTDNYQIEANDDLLICEECCDGDFCNSKGCGTASLPPRDQRGPICFNCHQQARADSCVSVTVCDKNQQCLLRHYETTGTQDVLYSSGCTYNTICDKFLPHTIPNMAVGRRGFSSCTGCCNDDFCNRECAAVHALYSNATSSAVTTKLPLATSTAQITKITTKKNSVLSSTSTSTSLLTPSSSMTPRVTTTTPVPTSTSSPSPSATSIITTTPSTSTFSSTPSSSMKASITTTTPVATSTLTQHLSTTSTITTTLPVPNTANTHALTSEITTVTTDASITDASPELSTATQYSTTKTNPKLSFAELCRLKEYDYDAADGVCYKIYLNETRSWNSARLKCSEDGGDDFDGDLVVFRTKGEELRFVQYATPLDADITYWVGASDILHEGTWTWVDGSHLNTWEYFMPYQPDNHEYNEDCAALAKLRDYPSLPTLLNDAPCEDKNHFICELRQIKEQSTGPCRNSDYTYHSRTGICYKIYDTVALQQPEARKHCLSESADLLILRNKTTEVLFQILHYQDRHAQTFYWIGGERVSGDRLNSKTLSFVWYNGRKFDPSLEWSSGEPNNVGYNENCVDMMYRAASYQHPYVSFALNDQICSRSEYFICEEQCPDHTYTYDATLKLCYKVYKDNVTWDEAKARCSRDRADLMELRTQAEWDYFKSHYSELGNEHLWVGARYDETYRKFNWKTLHTEVPARFWHTANVPDPGNGHCSYISYYSIEHRVDLSNQKCDTKLSGFVCQHIW